MDSTDKLVVEFWVHHARFLCSNAGASGSYEPNYVRFFEWLSGIPFSCQDKFWHKMRACHSICVNGYEFKFSERTIQRQLAPILEALVEGRYP